MSDGILVKGGYEEAVNLANVWQEFFQKELEFRKSYSSL